MLDKRVFATNPVYKQLQSSIRGIKILNEECYFH